MKLLEFPPDLLGTLIFSWLEAKSIVRLDSSICCKSDRSVFLRLLSSNHAVLSMLPPAELPNKATSGALHWATKRRVMCRTLLINSSVNLDTLDKYLCKERTFENVHVKGLNDTMCVCFMMVAHGRFLRSILFYNCNISNSVKNIFTNCTSLREVYFYGCSVLSAEAFDVTRCSMLETLALHFCGFDDERVHDCSGYYGAQHSQFEYW